MSTFATALFTGGLAGAVASFATQWFLRINRIVGLSRDIEITTETNSTNTDITCKIRVLNSGVETIKDAVGYITLGYEKNTDVQNGSAFINQNNLVDLNGDRLCWAVAAPHPNPHQVDICPGEEQILDVCRLHINKKIEIPSEQGWAGNGNKSRVFLEPKSYTNGLLRIVGKNVLPRDFVLSIKASSTGIKIDPRLKELPTTWGLLKKSVKGSVLSLFCKK